MIQIPLNYTIDGQIVPYLKPNVTYEDFINKELIHFSQMLNTNSFQMKVFTIGEVSSVMAHPNCRSWRLLWEFFSCSNGDCNFFNWMGAATTCIVSKVSYSWRDPLRRTLLQLPLSDWALKNWRGSSSSNLVRCFITLTQPNRHNFILPFPQKSGSTSIAHGTYLYEHYVNRLQASEFDFVEFLELARFLSIGIKRYVATISKHQ